MNGKNNLDGFSVQNFRQMAAVKDSTKVNIVVEWGRLTWKHVYRVRVTKGLNFPAEPKNNKKGTIDMGAADMGSVETLDSFVKWGKSSFPAEHYMLVIWDHGQGYRLEVASAPDRSVGALTMNLAGEMVSAIPMRQRSPGSLPTYRSISSDEVTGNHLYNSDIQKVVEESKIDVLGFDACLMSMLETGFAVRHGATVMIGSEELEPGFGWQYDAWLNPLIADPTLTPEKLGECVVNSYKSLYESGDSPEPSATLSACRLGQKLEHLATDTSELADVLIKGLSDDTKLAEIRAARKDCKEYAPQQTFGDPPLPRFNYIDLKRFAVSLKKHSSDSSVQAAAQKVSDAIVDCIVSNWAGSARMTPQWSSDGLSIYFPSSALVYANDRSNSELGDGYEKANADHPVEFVNSPAIHWSDFLHAYFSRVQTD
jgi:hypothetical protein